SRQRGRLGCSPRIASQKLTDQTTQVVQGEGMRSVRLDQACECGVVSLHSTTPQEVDRRVPVEAADFDGDISAPSIGLQVREGKSARDDGERAPRPLGE